MEGAVHCNEREEEETSKKGFEKKSDRKRYLKSIKRKRC